MKYLWRFISELFVWICLRAWLLWFAFLFLFIAPFIIIILSPENSDNNLRYFGMSLELLGIGTVVLGLKGRWQLFGLSNVFKNWWNQRPRLNPKPQNVSHIASGGVVMRGSADGYGWRASGSEHPIDVRLAGLEANVETLKNRLDKVAGESQKKISKLNDALISERQIRAGENKDIHNKLRELGAGGLHIEIVGVYWLTLGLIFSTIPEEVAHVFKRLTQFVIN